MDNNNQQQAEQAYSSIGHMQPAFKSSEMYSMPPGRQDLKLTTHEKDVLELIASGMTNIQMAQKLYVSVRTIETRRKRLIVKTGTSNTATLIRYAVKHGLID